MGVLGISEKAGIDYLIYKQFVDEYYDQIPKDLRITFMFECHRWASIRFGWSLVTKTHAKEIIELTFLKHPNCKRIVSMGSGTGYAEHMLFNASKDFGKPLTVHAFDLFPPKESANFDVKVKVGGVNSLRSLGSMDNAVLLLCWPPFGSRKEEQSLMGFDTPTLFMELG